MHAPKACRSRNEVTRHECRVTDFHRPRQTRWSVAEAGTAWRYEHKLRQKRPIALVDAGWASAYLDPPSHMQFTSPNGAELHTATKGTPAGTRPSLDDRGDKDVASGAPDRFHRSSMKISDSPQTRLWPGVAEYRRKCSAKTCDHQDAIRVPAIRTTRKASRLVAAHFDSWQWAALAPAGQTALQFAYR